MTFFGIVIFLKESSSIDVIITNRGSESLSSFKQEYANVFKLREEIVNRSLSLR